MRASLVLRVVLARSDCLLLGPLSLDLGLDTLLAGLGLLFELLELPDPLRLRVIRKDVARLKTVLKEKIIGIDQAHLADAKTKTKTKAGGAKTRRVRRTKSGATRSKKRA